MLDLKANHIYWIGINKTHSLYGSKTTDAETDLSPGSATYKAAESQLTGAVVSFIIFLGLEIVCLLLGVSVMFPQLTFLQNFLHGFGCLFTCWYLLDAWQYHRIWYLWSLFGVMPLFIEVYIIA